MGNNIKYVIAALPRSGTKYISTVLTKLGLNCSHELYFNCNTCKFSDDQKDSAFGDSSWMSVPYIDKLPPGTVVFHQLRDPIKVLNSNMPPDGDSYFRIWDSTGLLSDPLYKTHPWKRFIWKSTQNWVWPDGGGNVPHSKEEIQRLIHWWENWNLWVEFSATKRFDITYVRYRIEDLSPELLEQIYYLIKDEKEQSTTVKERCVETLSEVSTILNRHREPNTYIVPDMLPASARLLMYKYGY